MMCSCGNKMTYVTTSPAMFKNVVGLKYYHCRKCGKLASVAIMNT